MVLEHVNSKHRIGRAKGPYKKILDKIMPFTIGSLSGAISLIATQPFDTMKVIRQINSEAAAKGVQTKSFSLFNSHQSKAQIFRSLYKGLDSAIVRQITYTGARMGVYKSLFNRHQATHGKVSLQMKSLFGLIAGFFGSLVGNPADLILTRMQSDLALPPDQRRMYKNFLDAFFRIIKEEGFISLFRGSGPTIARAMVLNASQLSTLCCLAVT